MSPGRVVIVGAGLAGASVARALGGPSRLFEQGEQPGAEATAQNAGMLRTLALGRAERQLALRTRARLDRLGPAWDDLQPFRRTGGVLALTAPSPEHDRAVRELASEGGVVGPLERVPPALEGAALHRAWHLPEDGLLDAHALLTGMLREARGHGATLTTGARVEAVLVEGGRVRGVRVGGAVVPADAVVLAAGAWSGSLARELGLERPLLPLARHLLHTAPHPRSRPDHPWCWLDDVGIYVRPEAGGWLLSPCDEAAAEPRPGPGSRGPVDPLPRALAVHKLERWLPAVADAAIVGGWTGLRTFAPDRHPLLGPDPEVEGLWWATALGGFGVTCSLAVGEAVAAWMHGDPPAWLDREAVQPGRPLPPIGVLTPSRSDEHA